MEKEKDVTEMNDYELINYYNEELSKINVKGHDKSAYKDIEELLDAIFELETKGMNEFDKNKDINSYEWIYTSGNSIIYLFNGYRILENNDKYFGGALTKNDETILEERIIKLINIKLINKNNKLSNWIFFFISASCLLVSIGCFTTLSPFWIGVVLFNGLIVTIYGLKLIKK